MIMDRLHELVHAVGELDEQRALLIVEGALEAGDSPLEITRAGERGMRVVGERYEQGVYFLSGLIMAGEIFKGIMALVKPGLQAELSGDASGRVLLGTVAGDIHDIGKNIVTMALRGFGFTVDDLGVDVRPERFVEAARSFQPDVVGLSGLTSASYEAIRLAIEALRAAGEPVGSTPIIIGGAAVNQQVADFTGADHWTTDAMEGVRICERLRSPSEG
ncbi:MAG TPA: cobalamin-dependent protein [Thermoleophilia bacterium]|nr:cobalamin-dependent protein [Thermoleophilia bacterium]